MKLEDINLLDADRWAKGVPHEWFAYLRKHAPVYKHPEPDGRGFWVVSRYNDIRDVSMDWETFSSDYRRGGAVNLLDADMDKRMSGDAGDESASTIELDPPVHTARRKIMNRGLVPRLINALEQRIRAHSVELLEAAIARGRADWAEDVAVELPIRMVAELLGVPQEDQHRLLAWSNQIVSGEDPEYTVGENTVLNAMAELAVYARELAAKRRKQPGNDILSNLLGLNGEGDSMTDAEFAVTFLQLVTAGNETTRNTAIHGMKALMDNPDQYARLVADPGLIPRAVEEMLRWATAIVYFRRNATRDTEIGGVPISKGDKVVIYYTSANRDEEIFEEPFRFDVDRHPNPHVSFGAGGPHFCVGAHLAKLQLRVLFEELVKRVPRAPVAAGPAEGVKALLISGIKRLPVDFTRAA